MFITCKKYLNKLFTDVETRSLAWFTGYTQMDPYLVNQIRYDRQKKVIFQVLF